MQHWEDAATRSQVSLSWLNLGQQIIIALGVTVMMWRAADGVVAGTMTIGDLVLVNAFLIQLYMPLNFLGVVYREIRQALADIERMFDLLAVNREIADAVDAARWRLARCTSALPPWIFQLRAEPADPARRRFRTSHRAYARRRRRVGIGKIDPGAPALPLLRHQSAGRS
jgi:ABC-type multidrug transport system fused ATPase/permease subunit